MISRPLFRRLLRPIAGRERALWRKLRAPRLRYRLVRDRIDCVIYSLLVSLPHVRFIQIGSHDGRTNDPLWTFRGYPNWSGVLIEPVDYVYRRLARNYAPWGHRFILENAAIAAEGGTGLFHYFAESDALFAGYDQLGSLDPEILRSHLANFRGAQMVSRTVSCLTFQELCDKHGVREFDLLHIDAEGADACILEQVDWQRHRPSVVLYEHAHMTEAERTRARTLLNGAAYELVEIGIDTLAVRRGVLQSEPAVGSAWGLVTTSTGHGAAG